MNEITFEMMELMIENRNARLESFTPQKKDISLRAIIDIALAKSDNSETDSELFCKLNGYPILEEGVNIL